MLNVHFHGAIRHPGAAPSSAAWPPNIVGEAGFDVFLGLVFSGTSGTYTILYVVQKGLCMFACLSFFHV